MNELKKKTVLITGGTGSFGKAVIHRLLDTDCEEIRIFSRDEWKQEEMRIRYANPRLKFYIGDVRDKSSVDKAMDGVDLVFHAAALKQVPSCEFFPMQAVQTNVIGSHNVITSAIEHGIERIICLSTDKAAYPVNAMGISKAMMEKVALASTLMLKETATIVSLVRYGNVMCSRGSVIPLFIQQIKEGKPLTVTVPYMTRFLLALSEAVELVLFAFQHAEQGDLFIKKGTCLYDQRSGQRRADPIRLGCSDPDNRHPSWREDLRNAGHARGIGSGRGYGRLLPHSVRQS